MSENDKPVLTLNAFLPYRLVHLAETVSQSFSRTYAGTYGIGIAEWRVIAMLGERGKMSARDVSEATSMHKTKVSRAVAALDTRGLVRRGACPGDQRLQSLTLTDAGRELYADIVPRALAYSRSLEDALTPEQKAVLGDIFDRLHAAAREHSGD